MPWKMPSPVVLAACALMSGCATSPAHDPDIVVMGGAGGAAGTASRAGVAAMSLDELAQCARRILELEQRRTRMQRDSASIIQTKARIERRGDSLEAARAGVNVRNAAAVEAFNHQIQSHRSAVAFHNQGVASYNAAVDSTGMLRNTFNASCANRSYRRSHLQTLPASLRAAIERNSQPSDVPIRGPAVTS